MASRRSHPRSYDTVDSLAERSLSVPVQPSDDTQVKGHVMSFGKLANVDPVASIDSGFSSMQLLSPGSLSTQSSYDPSDSENVYNMSYPRRGHFVIINNRTFDRSTKMEERRGTDADAANLYTTFKKLGFDVDLKSNLSCNEMLQLMVSYATQDHSDCDCFAASVLTHGEGEGMIYGTDGTIQVKKLVEPLKRCKTLFCKPKLFIVQACRGFDFDEGVDVTDAEVFTDVPRPSYRLPKEADFLYAYSTAPGYYAFRNSTKGSPFITSLAKVFQDHGADLEVNRLLTRVNRKVAVEYESRGVDTATSGKKQVPSFESMLTKELYFPSKK